MKQIELKETQNQWFQEGRNTQHESREMIKQLRDFHQQVIKMQEEYNPNLEAI